MSLSGHASEIIVNSREAVATVVAVKPANRMLADEVVVSGGHVVGSAEDDEHRLVSLRGSAGQQTAGYWPFTLPRAALSYQPAQYLQEMEAYETFHTPKST